MANIATLMKQENLFILQKYKLNIKSTLYNPTNNGFEQKS